MQIPQFVAVCICNMTHSKESLLLATASWIKNLAGGFDRELHPLAFSCQWPFGCTIARVHERKHDTLILKGAERVLQSSLQLSRLGIAFLSFGWQQASTTLAAEGWPVAQHTNSWGGNDIVEMYRVRQPIIQGARAYFKNNCKL